MSAHRLPSEAKMPCQIPCEGRCTWPKEMCPDIAVPGRSSPRCRNPRARSPSDVRFDKFLGKLRQEIILGGVAAPINKQILPLNKSKLTQTIEDSGEPANREWSQHPDAIGGGLLGARRERPRRRPTEQRDELPPSHAGHGGLPPSGITAPSACHRGGRSVYK